MSRPRWRALLALLGPVVVAFGLFAATTVPASAVNLLVGRSSLAQPPNDSNGQVDTNPAKTAEAFPYVAINSGTANTLEVYVDSSSTAANVSIGLYSDNNGNPGTLLESGTETTVTPGWNAISVSGVSVTAGTTYWLAILSTSGTLAFLDDRASGLNTDQSQGSSSSHLNALPSTWSPGSTYTTDQASLFAGQN